MLHVLESFIVHPRLNVFNILCICFQLNNINFVITLALGSQPRQGLARLWAKKEAGSHVACSRGCRKVWGNQPSHSQGSFHFGNWSLDGLPNVQRAIAKVKKPMDWRVIYTIGKLLKRRCLKWARMTHLDIWNTSYGQKKGWESNW